MPDRNVIVSLPVSGGADGRDDDIDMTTPPTRSYLDALRQGDISEAELADLRAEIGQAEPSLCGDDDEDAGPTPFRQAVQSAPPVPRPPSQPPPVGLRLPSQPAPRPPSQPAPRPPSQPAPPGSSLRLPASQLHPPQSSSQALVDFGALLAGELPAPPGITPSPAADPVEVPLSVPSIRAWDQRAIDETYLDAIGGPKSVLRIAVSPGELRCLPLGAQAGFLVSCIDGVSTVDDLIDISGLGRLDTLRILYDLMQHGAIEIARRS